MKILKKINNPYLPAIIGTIALLILGQFLSAGFLSMNNISSILMTTSILTLASIGQAAVIISGDSGLDMSVGAIMSMTALFWTNDKCWFRSIIIYFDDSSNSFDGGNSWSN